MIETKKNVTKNGVTIVHKIKYTIIIDATIMASLITRTV